MKAKFVNEFQNPDLLNKWEKKTETEVDSEYYKQLCVWPGTMMGDNTAEDFENYFKDDLGVRVKFMEEVVTLPGNGGEGGRHDVFYIHNNDIGKFALQKLNMGISWWEDVISNKRHLIYPKEIIKKYPKTW